jgi:hypothetical protein
MCNDGSSLLFVSLFYFAEIITLLVMETLAVLTTDLLPSLT